MLLLPGPQRRSRQSASVAPKVLLLLVGACAVFCVLGTSSHNVGPTPVLTPFDGLLSLATTPFSAASNAVGWGTRQISRPFRKDLDSSSGATMSGAGGPESLSQRATTVARPVGAFVALHCALVTGKEVIGRGIRGFSSFIGARPSTLELSRKAEQNVLRARSSGSTASSELATYTKAKGLSGEWKLKDSGAQDEAMKMMGLGYLFRKATKLARGLTLTATERDFRITTRASIIEIQEAYPWDGSAASFSRRDKRGKHNARVVRVRDGAVELHVEWGKPAAGNLIQTFKLNGPNELVIENQLALQVDERTGKPPKPAVFTYNQIYTRK
mmetsp:Transcript_34835/g.56021  ORF Transcript_34835/g.56021 Transcript_34835/m.56021 type:complete len:328 (+) Transcript_34835:79-1062(+)